MRQASVLTGIVMMTVAATTIPPAAAQPQLPDGVSFVTNVEGISEFRLDNGLKVLLFPDPSAPKVTVNLTVFVGSRHEGYGEAGMAHLLEHMLFKGTPDHPAPPKTLKDLGASFNGTTWLDRTNYYETMPASDENLEAAIRLEADRMVNSYVRREDLDTEMTVVRNEFERGENSPSRVLGQRMFAAAYEWHNYGKSTIGNRADIERVPIKNLQAFYKKFYRPDNAMLVIAGEFNGLKALQFAATYFGSLENPDKPLDQTYTEEPAQDGERVVMLKRVGEVPLAGAMYHIPAGAHPDYVPLDVLERVMTAPSTGLLFKALVETGKCASVSGGAYALHDPGIIRFDCQLVPDGDPREVLDVLTEIVESAGSDDGGVTDELVEKAKNYWLKQWDVRFSDSENIARQLSEWAAQGDWRLLFMYRDRLEACTAEDVKRAASQYLTENNRTVGIFEPTDEAVRVAVPATPDLDEMFDGYEGREAIAQGEAFDPSPANIESRTTRLTLPSGMELALLPKKTRGESVNGRLTFRYGTPQSLAGYETAADTIGTLMTRGTKTKTREQIQEILDATKTTLSGGGSAGSITFSFETRREHIGTVLDLIEDIVKNPSFPASEFDIIKNQYVTAYEQQSVDPQALASTKLRQKTRPYEQGDVRYVPTLDEATDRWRSLEVDKVAGLYEKFFTAEHGQAAVVGDFDLGPVKEQIASLTDGLVSDQPYERITLDGTVEMDGEVTKIETPDKSNAVYLGGAVLPMSDDHPDYPAIYMGNYILGSSGLSSRLGDRVRQKEGLSYGVGSFLQAEARNERAGLTLYAITNPANVAKVESAINEEWNKLIADGITEQELADGVKGYLERQKLERSKDASVAGLLTSTLYHDRDMSFYTAQDDSFANLTTENVAAALKKWFGGLKRTTIVAGDFANAEKYAGE